MVPADFTNFFSVMAGVGATLFGLVFLIITIRPEVTNTAQTTVMRQVQVASSYSALLNPLIISLMALVPHATIGTTTLILSAIGLGNAIIMGISLLQDASNWVKKLKSIGFIVGSLIIFGYEFFYAIQLEITPDNRAALSNLTTFLVIIYLYGIVRAWDLVGARQFHLRDLYLPLFPKNLEEILSDTPSSENAKDANKSKD